MSRHPYTHDADFIRSSASESLIANTSSGPTPADFKPNYKSSCMKCGQKPTVDVFVEGNMVHASKMCGPCNFGDTSTIDPENW